MPLSLPFPTSIFIHLEHKPLREREAAKRGFQPLFLVPLLLLLHFFSFLSSGFPFLCFLLHPAPSFRCPILDLLQSFAEGHNLNPDFFFVNKMKMKLGSKKWKSIVPRLKGKSPSPSFCLFSKSKSAKYGPGKTPVYLNVYDLTPMNGYVYWAGLGIFHSGVEVHGVEYAFGAHDYPTSGVFEVEPRQCPGFKFRRSILIGTTCLDPHEVREFMEQRSSSYYGDTYHLIVKNCNHFCRDVCHRLTGKSIPKWVNRLAKIGSVCNCILPESLRISAVRHDPTYPPYETEKTKLRNAFSCLSSISSRQKQLSSTSLFLQSPLKGWELKKSNSEPSCLKG